MFTIGIIGNGFVGNATSQFENKEVKALVYDINSDKCTPVGLTLQELCEQSTIIFICLPTPMKKDGSCHLGIIEKVIENMKKYIDFDNIPVVIRSTVPVGTSDNLNCFFMPEFLTEVNALNDFKNTACWIIGLKSNNELQNKKVHDILIPWIMNTNINYGHIISADSLFVPTKEAEAIKLFKNTFLAVKVGFCNEFYRFCEANDVNYNVVVKGVVTDPRITLSHTQVPGNNGQFGFGGTCFPKDISSLQNQMNHLNIISPITDAVITRNNEIDRCDQDWKSDEGRAVINS
jgi:UDPglucose 6-dehydrogenase